MKESGLSSPQFLYGIVYYYNSNNINCNLKSKINECMHSKYKNKIHSSLSFRVYILEYKI